MNRFSDIVLTEVSDRASCGVRVTTGDAVDLAARLRSWFVSIAPRENEVGEFARALHIEALHAVDWLAVASKAIEAHRPLSTETEKTP